MRLEATCPTDRGSPYACMHARKTRPITQVTGGERHVQEVSADYAFLKETVGGETMTVLVMEDQTTKVIMAHPVMCKERGEEYAVQDVVCSLERLGYHRFVMKTDQEKSIMAVRRAVAARRTTRTGLVESKVRL